MIYTLIKCGFCSSVFQILLLATHAMELLKFNGFYSRIHFLGNIKRDNKMRSQKGVFVSNKRGYLMSFLYNNDQTAQVEVEQYKAYC